MGIFKCIVHLYKDSLGGGMSFGCCIPAILSNLKNTWIGNVSGSCVYNGWASQGYLALGTGHAFLEKKNPDLDLPKEFNIREGDKLTAEVNMKDRTLRFTNNGRALPKHIGSIPPEVYFGFCGNKFKSVAIECIGIQHLASPSPSSFSSPSQSQEIAWE